MLQHLLDLRSEVRCDTVLGALTEVVQHLLVTGAPAVEIVSHSGDSGQEEKSAVFDRVRAILIDAHWLDPNAPVDERRGGLRYIRVASPYAINLHVPPRLRLELTTEPAAAVLQVFLVLRVRYQITTGNVPTCRVEAPETNSAGLDLLYLIGDSFTERYPVISRISSGSGRVVLTLTGEPPLVAGGLSWARDDYIRCRDACLLVRPLRDSLEGAKRPLVIPREMKGPPPSVIHIRLPERIHQYMTSVRWLSTLQDLKHPSRGKLAEQSGAVGEHYAVDAPTGGYVAAGAGAGTDVILPIRIITPTGPPEVILSEAEDGSLAISLESLGGAREIGANCYYYTLGHRGLVIDAGFDATRDGWLGLPDFARIPRLDAVILTHAHLDHVGALPTLLGTFPNIPVYCTQATLAMLRPILNDSARVSGYRFEASGEAPALSYALVNCIQDERFRVLEYGVKCQVPEIPGLTIEFADAGHIIGSACTHLEFGGVTLLHTGDISVEDQHLIRGMHLESLSADHVIMEGTYCGEPEFTREDRRAAVHQFLDALEERLEAGGSVLVPAFSLGRAQELVGLLVDWNRETGRTVPIWTVGMVNQLNQVSAANSSFLPGMNGNPFGEVRPFPLPDLRKSSEMERRAEYARAFFDVARRSPCVVIASHGMMAEGTGSYLIGRAILAGDDPRHAIFLCGYMDPRTPGFRLRHQCDQSVIDFGPSDLITRNIPPDRIQFHRLTAHASYEELVEVASRVARRSVTFIHGDGRGLDSLIEDLRRRTRTSGLAVRLRAPAIGERILLAQATRPPDWDVESDPPELALPGVGLGRRKFRPENMGLSVRGLSEDRRWALIPIGHPTVTLALDPGRVNSSQIDRLEIRHRDRTQIAYDRMRHEGSLTRIELDEPGRTRWIVHAHDPSDRPVRAELDVFCGGEVRPLRSSLDATAPVLELQLAGTLRPEVEEITSARGERRYTVRSVQWEADTRVLRVALDPLNAVGVIENLQLRIRWSNGFSQYGPSLEAFSVDPRVILESDSACVGVQLALGLRSSPTPLRVRVAGNLARLDGDRVYFVPERPGSASVELEYQSLTGDQEWREVGTLDIKSPTNVDCPSWIERGQSFELTVQQVAPHLIGKELTLMIAGQCIDRWIAGRQAHLWSGRAMDQGLDEFAVSIHTETFELWSSAVAVRDAIHYQPNRSLRVTTADGKLNAELAFPVISDAARSLVERALSEVGFSIRGWRKKVLLLTGTPTTIGVRAVPLAIDGTEFEIRLVTLPDLNLRLMPSGPFQVGGATTLHTAGGAITSGLRNIDGGPLEIRVERIAPLVDALSTNVLGHHVRFLHPGKYSIELCAGGRSLAGLQVQVAFLDRLPERPVATLSQVQRADTVDRACALVAARDIVAPSAIVRSAHGQYEVLHGKTSVLVDQLSTFLSGRIGVGEKVLVVYPGLALNEITGQLLSRLRSQFPQLCVAHLSYPTPRGEIATQTQARELLSRGVLCCAPANAIVDRLDAYRCPICPGTPILKTNANEIWQECPACGHTDRDLILTLNRLRTSDVQVLISDFRMAKYLLRGRGRRYAGAFGQTVRCNHCNSAQSLFARPAAWDSAELHRLLRALTENWNAENPKESLHRAANVASGRSRRTRPSDVQRIEEILTELIECQVMYSNGILNSLQVQRLEAGLSLCCGKPLSWSKHRIASAVLNLEQLLDPTVPSALHPNLLGGEDGIKQVLSLTD